MFGGLFGVVIFVRTSLYCFSRSVTFINSECATLGKCDSDRLAGGLVIPVTSGWNFRETIPNDDVPFRSHRRRTARSQSAPEWRVGISALGSTCPARQYPTCWTDQTKY